MHEIADADRVALGLPVPSPVPRAADPVASPSIPWCSVMTTLTLPATNRLTDSSRTHRRALEAELDRILEHRLIRSVYQPLVDLDAGGVIAYEALARGPAGSILESPAALFETALFDLKAIVHSQRLKYDALRRARPAIFRALDLP